MKKGESRAGLGETRYPSGQRGPDPRDELLEQYAGRLHRLHEGKRVVMICDYVDVHVPVLVRMYRKRLKRYRSIGYSVGQSLWWSGQREEETDEQR